MWGSVGALQSACVRFVVWHKVEPDLVEMATALTRRFRIGKSGWSVRGAEVMK